MRGVLAHFNELDSLVEAIEDLKERKSGDITVYTPTPRHEIEHAIHAPPSPVRKFTLIGGLLGWAVSARPQTLPMIGILAAGKLIALAPADELKQRYESETLEDAFFAATGKTLEDEEEGDDE